MSNVRHLDTGIISPTDYAMYNHLRDAVDSFLEQHPMSVAQVLGVLETIKLSVWAESIGSNEYLEQSE